jgi:SNF2 family DNA or RNA helicase
MKTKFKVGKYLIPVTLEYRDDRVFFHFRYNKPLIDIIKTSFEKRKWHGPPINPNGPKVWSAPLTQRNEFVLKHLQAREHVQSPYHPYDYDEQVLKETIKRIDEYILKRYGNSVTLYEHQKHMIAHGLLTKSFIWAAEMGTGKTLAAFILMEMSNIIEWIWVAPRSALRAAHEEIYKWNPLINPILMTYDSLKKYSGTTPQGLILDESAKTKTPTAQRSIAARNLSNTIRDKYSDNYCIGLLSGAPAPRSPVDWWHQCEIACPGFLREGSIFTFRERLGIFEDVDGAYKKLNTWLDNPDKCAKCGLLREDVKHQQSDTANIIDALTGNSDKHTFVKSKDEVSYLYKRLSGLVLIKLKKDCLDLPEKIYERRVLEPDRETISAAKLILVKSTRVIEALTRLRMLSDGFQYIETESGKTVCSLCKGKGEYEEYYDPNDPDEYVPEDWANQGIKRIYDVEGELIEEVQVQYAKRLADCPNCSGTGAVPTYTRTVDTFPCPKDNALKEDLEIHEEVGRLNIYAGFTASVDRVVQICQNQGWTTIRADGRGWEGCTPYGEVLDNNLLLRHYQNGQDVYPKMAFIGQPGAAGEGLTLTASPTTVFWSNDFNGNSRIQAEDRGHRIGMDIEKGGRIVDYLHLDSDIYVLNNLQQKKDLQRQSMTGLRSFCHADINEKTR